MPPAGVYLMALSTRLPSARRSAPASPSTAAGSSASARTVTPVPWARRAPASSASRTSGSSSTRVPRRPERRGGAREEQQVLDEADQVLDLFEARVEHPAVLLGRARGAKRHLHLALERRQRRAQLVGRVRREALGLGEGRLETGQHGVERVGQVVDLVIGAPPGKPPAQILGRDLARRPRHLPHGLERPAGEDGAAGRPEADRHRHQRQERRQVARERLARAREGQPRPG